jgi:hypothetical protein
MMTTRFRIRIAGGLVVCGCLLLAACGGSSPSAQGNSKSGSPGSGDVAICQKVAQAKQQYDAKDLSSWRSTMQQIGEMANSAQYDPIRSDAEVLKRAYNTTGTTTKANHKPKGSLNDNQLLVPVVFVGLQKTCAHLPIS